MILEFNELFFNFYAKVEKTPPEIVYFFFFHVEVSFFFIYFIALGALF